MPSPICRRIMPQCLFPAFWKVVMGSWAAGVITAMVDGSICFDIRVVKVGYDKLGFVL